MLRRVAPWFGALNLAIAAVVLAAFGRPALADPTTGIVALGLVAAGLLSIAGGTLEAISIGPRTIPWNVLVGAAECTVALTVALVNLRTIVGGAATADAALVAAGTLVGAAALGWLGVQTARDARHVDLEATPSRRRLVAVGALAVGSVGIGLLVAAFV